MGYFGANSAYDVGINAAGIDIEQANDRQIMAYFHATFSAFGALGALSTGILLTAGINFRLLYAGLSIGVVPCLALLVWARTLPDRRADHRSQDGDSDQRTLFRNSAMDVCTVSGCESASDRGEAVVRSRSA